MHEIIEDIGKITVFLLLLLAVYLFSAKSTKQLANRLFGCFLVITALEMSGFFLLEFFTTQPLINYIRLGSVLLQMPFYFLFVKASCFTDFKLKLADSYHFIPFILCSVTLFSMGINDTTYFWYDLTSQVQFYLYITAVFVALQHYKKLELENYSFKNEVYTLLTITTVLFLLGNSMLLLRYFSEVYINKGILVSFRLINALFALVIICWFVLKTMRTPEIFSGINSTIDKQKIEVTYDSSEYKSEVDKLHKFMNSEKPYLDNTLTLQVLSNQLNWPQKHLSFLINKVNKTHFFDFVNAYRIEEAKSLLQNKDFTIQEVMYQVGFNSKSSFNTAFKKHTKVTPSNFRKSIR